MKIIYSFIIAALFSMGIHAQGFTLNFEDTTVINQVFYTDSILDPQGIWQIGPPHKSFMNAAYSPTNGIMTELDSLLPPGSRGSFIITLPGIQINPSWGGYFTFVHRYQFDTAHGGGYVEFSVDTGKHWHGIYIDSVRASCYNAPWNYIYFSNGYIDTVDGQVIPVPQWWDNVHKDTLPSGRPYFTGTDSTWIFDTISFPTFVMGEKTSQITQFMFRFTAFADSLSAPLGGWLIDNISFSSGIIGCGGGIDEINSAHLKVYPNPAINAFDISILNEPESEYHITLYDLEGRVVMEKDFSGQSITMQRGEADGGSYFIQVTDKRTSNTFQKRVVFE